MSKLTKCRKARVCDLCGRLIDVGQQYIKVEVFKAYIPSLGRPIYDARGFHPSCYSGNLEHLSGLLSCDRCGEGFVTGGFTVREWRPFHDECAAGPLPERKEPKSDDEIVI